MVRPDKGSVLIEAALSIFIFVALLTMAVDFALYYREQTILTEAARVGARAAVMIEPYNQDTMGKDFGAYAAGRYEWSAAVARRFISENGLNPQNFEYGVSTVLEGEDGMKFWYVLMNVRSKASSHGFFLLRRFLSPLCAGAKYRIQGKVIEPGNYVGGMISADYKECRAVEED